MGRIAYVNGQYVPHAEAGVHVEDRGYQFSDGVYEVIAVYGGHLIDEQGHLDRLGRSLRELEIAWPVAPGVLKVLMREIVRRNRLVDGIIYLQITRGVAPRDHRFPKDAVPSLIMTAAVRDIKKLKGGPPTRVITVPDLRWARPDIKTVSLLPNCLAREKAERAGCYEAWQVDRDGRVTEGSSSNAWIVTADDELVTRDTGENAILNGITRIAVLEVAEKAGLKLIERAFTVDEAKAAREAFLTSTTSFVKPVTEIDGHAIADGKPGALTRKLGALISERLEAQVAT